jgi:UDPglucose 6-dehydrogenase
MLATRISFMNEMANLCELIGADVNLVRKGIGSDSRIGTKFIYPGLGYGGSCFPKDVKALIKTAEDKGHPLRILSAVDKVNEYQKEIMFHKISRHFSTGLKDRLIAIWGLSFKPNTDDMREAPALVIIQRLLEQGARVKVYDPAAMDECRRRMDNRIDYAEDRYEALIDADALVVVTEWQEFRIPNFKIMKKLMKHHVVFDGRNIYDPDDMHVNGFTYYGIGRKMK